MAQQLLTRADFEEVYDLALELGLSDPSRRSLLLAWIDTAIVANLPRHAAPAAQLNSDLQALNAIPPSSPTADAPLVTWLQNAHRLTRYLPAAAQLLDYSARAQAAAKAPPPAAPRPIESASRPTVATTDLIIRIRGRERTLTWRGVELASASAPALDWQAEIFGPDADLPLRDVLSNIDGTWDYVDLTTLGTQLAALLFPDLGDAADDALADATRVVLDLDAHAARAPWEYLYIGGAFVVQRALSVVRHVAHRRARPLTIDDYTPVALISANPTRAKVDEYDESAHRKAIRDALPGGAVLDLAQCDRRALIDSISNNDRTVRTLHFLGHGHARAGIALVDDKAPDGVRMFSAQKLAGLLQYGKDLRLVVLGACHSGAMAQSPRGLSGMAWQIAKTVGVPVVAMQAAVPQGFSTSFVAELYHQLANADGDVERAVELARRLADSDGFEVFGTPVLYADVGVPST